MALFSECMLECARKLLDTADIVRDGDFSPIICLRRVFTAGQGALPAAPSNLWTSLTCP
jgi:hypothetical protein